MVRHPPARKKRQGGPDVVPICSPSPSTRIRAMAHSVSRFTIVVGLLASAMLALGATPAEAKKRAAPAASSSAPVDDEVPGEKKAAPAAQAGDVERPKPIVDDAIAPESGPKADDRGNVTFTGGKSGKGKITVQAPPKEKVKVYL